MKRIGSSVYVYRLNYNHRCMRRFFFGERKNDGLRNYSRFCSL